MLLEDVEGVQLVEVGVALTTLRMCLRVSALVGTSGISPRLGIDS
jgi:hypothetical protein